MGSTSLSFAGNLSASWKSHWYAHLFGQLGIGFGQEFEQSQVGFPVSLWRSKAAERSGTTQVPRAFVKTDIPEQAQLRANEAELIKRVCNGDREAFYELVRPYERLVYATAISVVKNPADAEEVAQEAVLKAFSNLASFRAESKFSTWMLQITYNEARMRLRKAHSHLYESIDDPQQSEDGDYWPKDFADWRPIPSELFETDEVRQAIQNATNSLRAIYREVFVLRDVQNLSTKETATILGISEVAVKIRLLRGRLQMRDTLAPGIDGCGVRGQPYQKVRPW